MTLNRLLRRPFLALLFLSLSVCDSPSPAAPTVTPTPVLSTTLLIPEQDCIVGERCVFTPVGVSGGTPPYAFSYVATEGALPAGLTMSSNNGRFGEVPTEPGAATVRVDVRDGGGATSSRSFDLVVIELLATTSLVDEIECTVGLSCIFLPMVARGGEPPYVYSITGGVLVDGMALDPSNGEISGTPTMVADDTLTVTVTDQAGSQLSDTVRFAVLEELSTTQEIPEQVCAVNEACAFVPVTASGGRPPYRFALNEGALPAGMTFDEVTGAFAGTPVEIVDRQITVTVTDDREDTSAKVFRLLITEELVAHVLYPEQHCARGAPCSFRPMTVSGGQTPYRYQITGGALPSGMTFGTATGIFDGTPEALFDDILTVTVTDDAGDQASGSFRLIVSSGLVTTLTTPIQTCTAQHVCAFTPVTVAGGTPPYRFATNSLPGGMTFDPTTGAFGGVPAGAMDISIVVTVADEEGGVGMETFQLVVNPPLETHQHIAAQECLVLSICDFTPISASAGTPPYLFTYTTGQLPPGMTFAPSTGRFSGIPTAVTLQLFNIVVTDAAGASGSREVGLATLATLSAALLIATQNCDLGVPCTFTPVQGQYGIPPYRYELSGTLPAGMTFDPSTGTIDGTPEEVIDQTMVVTVRDEADFAASQEFRFIVMASGPATARWINPAGGSWSDGQNWDIGRVPRDGDDVEIQLDGDYLVRIEDDQDVTLRSLTLGGALGNQRLIAVDADRGSMHLSGGGRILAGGELTLRRFALSGGPVLNDQGGSLILNWADVESDLENRGTLEVLGYSENFHPQWSHISGTFTTTSSSVIHLVSEGDGTARRRGYLSTEAGFVNQGSLILDSDYPRTINNNAELRVLSGTLRNSESGRIEMLAEWWDPVDGWGNSTGIVVPDLVNQGVITGTGLARLQSDRVVNEGRIHIRDGGRFSLLEFQNQGIFELAGGTATGLEARVTVNVGDGGVGLTNTGSIDIQAGHELLVRDGAFSNTGSLVGDGILRLWDGQIVSDTPIALGEGDLGGLSLNRVTVDGPAPSTANGSFLEVINSRLTWTSPLVNEQGSTLHLEGVIFDSDIENRGLLRVLPTPNVASGLINGGATDFNGELTTTETSQIEVLNQHVFVSTASAIYLNLAQGLTNHGSLRISATSTVGGIRVRVLSGALVNAATGILDVDGGTTSILYGSLENQGAMTLGVGGFYVEAEGASVINSGSIDATAPILYTDRPTLRIEAGTFTNSGTLDAGAGIGELDFDLASDGGFTNTGSVAIHSDRTLRVTEGTFDYADGAFTGGGTLHLVNVEAVFQQPLDLGAGDLQSLILDNSTLTSPSLSNTGGGTLRLVSTTVDIPNVFVNAAGGTLDLAGSTFNGDIDNQGLIRAFSAWSAWESSINGSLSTSTGSRLEVRDYDPVGNRSGSIALRLSEGLTNEGEILLSSTGGYLPTLRMDGGTLVNSAGGTLELFGSNASAHTRIQGPLQNDGEMTLTAGRFSLEASGAAVVNNGIMTISSATSQPTVTLTASTFTNNGTFDAGTGSGQLTFTLASDGGFTNAGETLLGVRDLSVTGPLVVPAATLGSFEGSGGISASGLDIDGALFRGVRLTSTGGGLARFDNVTFDDMDPTATQFTVNHPGAAAPYTFDGISFLQTPTTGRFILVSDTNGFDGAPLIIELTNSVPADGSAYAEVTGGAEVRWQ